MGFRTPTAIGGAHGIAGRCWVGKNAGTDCPRTTIFLCKFTHDEIVRVVNNAYSTIEFKPVAVKQNGKLTRARLKN